MANIRERKLPGTKKNTALAELLRVDHAGEFGAQQIYAGQMRILKDRPELQHMAEQEAEHLAFFDEALKTHRIRPTLLHPLWRLGAYALGLGTAALGPRAAHTCTHAVEDTIETHYQEQLDYLNSSAAGNLNSRLRNDLIAAITRFRNEELEHRDLALEQGAQELSYHPQLYRLVAAITKGAIALSKKI